MLVMQGYLYSVVRARILKAGFERIESFGFEDEDYCEYKILLKVCWRIDKKYSTQRASLYYFLPEKLVRLFLLKKV